MRKFIGYFENKKTLEINDYSNHSEDKRYLIVKTTDGLTWKFYRIDMKAIYGNDMPMNIVYKYGFIKFERFEIVDCK